MLLSQYLFFVVYSFDSNIITVLNKYVLLYCFVFPLLAVRPRCIQMTCQIQASSSCFTTRRGAHCCGPFTASLTDLRDIC